jgi:hypothetical protein
MSPGSKPKKNMEMREFSSEEFVEKKQHLEAWLWP